MTHHRDRMDVRPPPPELNNPMGRWWCVDCGEWADSTHGGHVWEIRRREQDNEAKGANDG